VAVFGAADPTTAAVGSAVSVTPGGVTGRQRRRKIDNSGAAGLFPLSGIPARSAPHGEAHAPPAADDDCQHDQSVEQGIGGLAIDAANLEHGDG